MCPFENINQVSLCKMDLKPRNWRTGNKSGLLMLLSNLVPQHFPLSFLSTCSKLLNTFIQPFTWSIACTFSNWPFWDELKGLRLEKAMAPHSSTLAWKIMWMEEPGRLQSMGSLRVGHDWATSLSLCTFMHWRRKWQPTPVFLPGESQGRGSLVGCRLWDHTELGTTEAT